MKCLRVNTKCKILLWFVIFIVTVIGFGNLRESALADQGRLVDVGSEEVVDVPVGIVLFDEDGKLVVYRYSEDNRWQMPMKVVFDRVSDN